MQFPWIYPSATAKKAPLFDSENQKEVICSFARFTQVFRSTLWWLQLAYRPFPRMPKPLTRAIILHGELAPTDRDYRPYAHEVPRADEADTGKPSAGRSVHCQKS